MRCFYVSKLFSPTGQFLNGRSSTQAKIRDLFGLIQERTIDPGRSQEIPFPLGSITALWGSRTNHFSLLCFIFPPTLKWVKCTLTGLGCGNEDDTDRNHLPPDRQDRGCGAWTWGAGGAPGILWIQEEEGWTHTQKISYCHILSPSSLFSSHSKQHCTRLR